MTTLTKVLKADSFMTTVRCSLSSELCAKHTYGYITKSGRIALKLEKTHYNDAFVIADGSTAKRATPIFMGQNLKYRSKTRKVL